MTDVAFLIDASETVSSDVLRRQKDFVKSLASSFKISPSGPRGSVVVYARNPYTIASFIERDFNSRVDSVSVLSTPRRMDKALQHAGHLFRTSGRPGRKIIVLLTTGRQQRGAKPLNEIAIPLRKRGIQTFVVAIGREADQRDNLLAVDRPEDVFRSSAEELPSKTQQIARAIRDKPGWYYKRIVKFRNIFIFYFNFKNKEKFYISI